MRTGQCPGQAMCHWPDLMRTDSELADMGPTPQEVAPACAVIAAAMLAEACGGTAEARKLTAGLTREITAQEAGCVIARNARYGVTYRSISAS